ncbi:uncharacterized protein LOC111056787 isoform X2 [Nilaparvata lugens]|uniref:uncharacterized protein LOC111056787 isoform X2 n=1 Tax=Nilaparvata lugens TaxID=108931 RepID=UPI00193D5E3F|nr:uncharacterized protein LOC111056787 isoform X2 [Nilaparvata lugens]
MSPASFSGRFLLIIFLQLLRSTTTSPSVPTSVPVSVKEDTANLPLIVFQHHHHSHIRNLGDFPTTQLPQTSHEDYYAYNVMSAGGVERMEEREGEEEEGGVRKHHSKLDDSKVDEVVRKHHYKLDDSKVDEVVRKHHPNLDDLNVDKVVDTVARKHHYKLDDSNVDEVVMKHHPKLDDMNVDEVVDIVARKHHYKLDDSKVDELVRKHHYKLDDPNVDELVAFRGKKHHGEATGKSPMRTLYQVGVCEPVHKLPRCRYFRDVTWTLRTEAGNGAQQTMHCLCPRGSVAYLINRLPYQTSNNAIGYQYSFACSPQSRLRCQRKEPCRLFTVRRRQELLDEVNTNTLCQCPRDHSCPTHHTHTAGVVQGKTYLEENVRTYSGYCLPNY